jgi:hypothetical protein
MLLKERDVLEEELFLQGLGAGRHDDALPRHQRGNQVRERFSGTGTGLDDQVPAIGNRAFDALRHLHLPGPELIGRVPLREGATLPEKLSSTGGADRGGHGFYDFTSEKSVLSQRRENAF